MKRIFSFVAGAMLALGSFGLVSAASAADLQRPVYKAPAPVYMAPAPMSADGFFAGVSGGYEWSNFEVNGLKYDMNAFVVRGEIGYEWQGWRLSGVGAWTPGQGHGYSDIGGGPITSCGACPGGPVAVGTFTNFQAVDASAWRFGAQVATPLWQVVPQVGFRAFGGAGYASLSTDISNYTRFEIFGTPGTVFNTPVSHGSVNATGFYGEVGLQAEFFKNFNAEVAYIFNEASGSSNYLGGTEVKAGNAIRASLGASFKF